MTKMFVWSQTRLGESTTRLLGSEHSRVKTRRRTTSRQKSNRTRLKLLKTTCLIIIIIKLILNPLIIAAQSTSRIKQEISPAVVLPKFGLIRGLKFEPSASDKSGQSSAVAAFLGIPYAAPPMGPLRFMPPGAVRPSQTRAPNRASEQCQLLPGRNVAQSRIFGKFGHECVQLSSWLRPRPTTSTDLGQSEDCLKLNLFVPYEPLHLRELIKRAPPSEANDSIIEIPSTSSESVAQIPLTDDHDEGTRSRSTRANSDPKPNDKSISLNESTQEHQGDKTHCYLDQINANQQRYRRKPLPVMVVFHSGRDRGRRWQPNGMEQMSSAGEQQSDNKANSLAFVEVAQRTQSIVVTFNYRIGLLGYLPYIDQMDQFQHSSGSLSASSSSGQARYNHAIWDQLGLLHWLKHNIANFNGDPGNLTLVSADNEAAKHIQLLAMSPISKGLFAKLVLVQDQRQDKQEVSDGNEHLERLLELAIKSREMKRKLINEMSLLVRKLKADNVTSTDGNSNNNVELDRNMFEFLKDANLSELASIELRLSELKLLDFISEPNLDDRMLFPYFAQLIKMNQLAKVANLVGDTNSPSSRRSDIGDNFANIFLSALSIMPNRLAPNDSSQSLLSPASSDRVELDYCLYLAQLYDGVLKLDSKKKMLSVHDLDDIDPFKVIPRISEHMIQMASKSLASINASDSNNQRLIQKTSPSPWLSPWSWFRSNSNAEENGDGENNTVDSNGNSAPVIKGNWTQSRLVSAAQFYHLRNAHLLNQFLVQKLNALGRSQALDDDDEEDENSVSKQQRSLMLMSQHQQDSIGSPNPRAKRDTLLDQLTLLGDQLVELVSSYDLFIGFIGKPVRPQVKQQQQQPLTDSSATMDSLLNITERGGHKLDLNFAFWLKMADLHFVSHSLRANGHNFKHVRDELLGNSCDFISDKIQRMKQRADGAPSSSGNAQDLPKSTERSTYVFVTSNKITFTIDSSENDWVLDANGQLIGPLTSFIHSSQSSKVEFHMNETQAQYNTMSRHINLLGELLKNETKSELEAHINVHFNLVPYLNHQHNILSSPKSRLNQEQISKRGDLLYRSLTPPRELSSCLNDLDSKLKQAGNAIEPNDLSTRAKFGDDLRCLTREVGRLRGHLRAGAGKELEPLVVQFLTALVASRSNATNLLQPNHSDQLSDMQLASINQHQRVSSMTTRNLINQSEAMFLDQFEASGMNVGLNDQSASESRSASSANSLGSITNSDQAPSKSNQLAHPTTSSIRSFFAKTYKDAVGQALGIVIGTGALIFLLNLIIVLVIALRSARHNRRAEGKRRNCAAVQDVNQMEYLTPSSNLPPAELLQRDFQALQTNCIEINGSEQSKSKLIADGKQLTSSFKQQTDIADGNSTRKRSMKSIKFNLSGVDGETEDPEYHDNKIDYAPYASNANVMPEKYPEKNCLLHPQESKIVANSFGGGGGDQQQFQLTSSSPSYLLNEFSDEIELDQMSADEEERQFRKYIATNNTMHLDSGPIYVTHQHQMADLQQADGSTSNSCRLHQNQQRFNRSLGSSSLTSPFASQTTPSNNTSSNSTAVYTIQAADMNIGAKMNLMHPLIPDQNQSEMFLESQHVLYSPSSSTMSAETPIRPPQRTVSMIAPHNGQLQTSCAYHQVQNDSMRRLNSSLRLAGSQGNLVAQDQANSYLIYAPQSNKHTTTHSEQQQQNSLDPTSVQLLIMPTTKNQNYQEAHRYQ